MSEKPTLSCLCSAARFTELNTSERSHRLDAYFAYPSTALFITVYLWYSKEILSTVRIHVACWAAHSAQKHFTASEVTTMWRGRSTLDLGILLDGDSYGISSVTQDLKVGKQGSLQLETLLFDHCAS